MSGDWLVDSNSVAEPCEAFVAGDRLGADVRMCNSLIFEPGEGVW
jgi:hypothetical protein